jgi:F420H(2)-dependent biliverdin reductase
VAVGFTFDPKTHIARVITTGGSQKAVNADRAGVAVLSQVDGARWVSLEGRSQVNSDADAVRDAELRYAQRYRNPRPNPRRVVIEVQIERVLGSSDLLDRSE